MSDKKTFRVSVRDLVAASFHQNSLSGAYASKKRALEGIKEHARIAAMRPEDYEREVAISILVEQTLFDINIFGRIDGVYRSENKVIIEEIKSCQTDPDILGKDPFPNHMAQLKCYGYMYITAHNLDSIRLVLTYGHTISKKTHERKQDYTLAELAKFFDQILKAYVLRLETFDTWKQIRNKSIKDLAFPYPEFRQGQRDLAEAVYRIIKNKKILFARAPTGTGKTIATLFPAIKSLGMNQVDKIFYLTAKTLGRTVAKKAIQDMGKKGLRLKTIILTAKQKICFTEDETCDMEVCPFARSYYTKLKSAMVEIKRHDLFDQILIEKISQTYKICPFELSLDISLECDLIVCDLNYAFDPRVYLKRFFDHDNGKYTFLIDEAHNLPDRLRSMYSADLLRSSVLEAQKLTRNPAPNLSAALVDINKSMVKIKTRYLEKKNQAGKVLDFEQLDLIPDDFLKAIKFFLIKADVWLDQNQESSIRKEFIEFYFAANNFLIISQYFDSNYRFFIERKNQNNIQIRLFCMDPSPVFSDLIQRSSSSILFSASFFPKEYYQTILLGNRTDPFYIELPSPFPEKNLGVFIHADIQTTYRQRNQSYNEIARIIQETVQARKGNYLVFFPSYEYMNCVRDVIKDLDLVKNIQIQEPGMSETERQEFLDQFRPQGSVTGFAVMGGIFGEGIDLEGNRLVGAIIVGVGLPQICPEQDQIRAYYDQMDQDGFFYAYQMPGFNRVIQAAGRVIRTETDQGILVLLDQRFVRKDYQFLCPDEWKSRKIMATTSELKQNLLSFWNDT